MSSKYECKKCKLEFEDLNDFKGHNLKCKPPESERKKRIPIGVPRRKLSFDNVDPAFSYRWVNDRDNRLNNFMEGGYEFVGNDSGTAGDVKGDQGIDSRLSKVVMTNDDGSPRRAYLMRIKKEWFDEDQAEKQRRLDEMEKQIEGGMDSQGRPGQDGRFIPSDGTKIQRE